MADEIINARVKQKVDTEENWLANPLILLEGEQGFVWTDSDPNQPVNFKIGDGTKTFAELPYFIAYYSNVISHKIIRLPNVSTPQSILSVFNQNTNLYDIVVTNVGGLPVVLKLGTTVGGSEIGEYNVGAGNTVIDLKYMFESTQTLYLSGFDTSELSIIVIYFNYAENPVIPPSGGEGLPFRWPKGHLGMFIPIGVGHLEQCFDMITGMGIVGSKYENCQICNVDNPYLDMTNSYPVGYATGLTIGANAGNQSGNLITLVKANLPNSTILFTYDFINQQRGNTGSRYNFTTDIWGSAGGAQSRELLLGGSNTPFSIQPKSKVVLYYLAITD